MSKVSEVEHQFAQQFVATDWVLFKQMADANLSEAAQLRTKHVHKSDVNALLARNVRKRLLIGLGSELLLKAAYLKAGYAINSPRAKGMHPFPSTFESIGHAALHTKTATFDDCLKHLKDVVTLHDEPLTLEGLRIARVFRNKEAHSVTDAHTFDPQTYRVIESSLRALYRDAFAEELSIKITMTKHDKAVWKIKGNQQ